MQLELDFKKTDTEAPEEAFQSWEEPLLTSGDSQLQIDFSHQDDSGYERWKQERLNRVAKLRAAYGLPLLRRVSVRLQGLEDTELVGLLTLPNEPESNIDVKKPLMLRIGSDTFSHHEISSIMVVEEIY